MTAPKEQGLTCSNCEAPLVATEEQSAGMCKTCRLAKRLIETPEDNRPTSEKADDLSSAIISGIFAAAVTTASWITLAKLTPWLPSFLWCFIIGGAISFAITSKMKTIRPEQLTVGVGLIGSLSVMTGVYLVRFRYINDVQFAQGLPNLPLWPGRETFIQVLTAGETPLGFAQLAVLFVAIAAGGITAGVMSD